MPPVRRAWPLQHFTLSEIDICRSGPEGALLRKIEAQGVPTFCGASFDHAVEVVETLNLERPIAAASAMLSPAARGSDTGGRTADNLTALSPARRLNLVPGVAGEV